MVISLKRAPEESDLQFIWRICSAKDSGGLNLTWPEIADILNEELIEDESEYLGESAYRKKYQQAKAFYEEVFSKFDSNNNNILEEIRELRKERYKLQTEKLEYNQWLREVARDELFEEKVIEAIKNNVDISNPPKKIEVKHGNKAGVN